jgi:phosphate transport system substrate-binding protein
MKITKIIAAVFAAVALNAAADEKIIIDGSTTVGPIAKAFAEHFMAQNPGISISVSESGSGNGAKSLINGACDIASMSRPMKENEVSAAEKKGIKAEAHIVALDGLAVVVNPANPVKALTTDQIRDIYTGKTTNWKDVGGPNLKIIVVGRDTNSGTYETFETKVLNKMEVVSSAEVTGANGAVLRRVSSTRGAIGYLGIGFLDKSVKPVPVDGIESTPETVQNNTYPIARPLFLYTNGQPKAGSALEKFIGLSKTAKGREIIEAVGFVPVPEKK